MRLTLADVKCILWLAHIPILYTFLLVHLNLSVLSSHLISLSLRLFYHDGCRGRVAVVSETASYVPLSSCLTVCLSVCFSLSGLCIRRVVRD